MKRTIRSGRFAAGMLLAASACLVASAAGAQGQPAAPAAAPAASGSKPYTVVDGYKVDAKTYDGFKAWRAAACSRCHGANQEGLVGPSLIDSLKVMTKEQVETTITNGRIEKGMPSWKSSKIVMDNLDNLYAYLKGRSDGAITRAEVEPISK